MSQLLTGQNALILGGANKGRLADAIAQAFQVQSIPAVYALKDGKVIDGFMGAYPEHIVQEFVNSLLPSEGEQQLAALLAEGTEGSFRAALEIDPRRVADSPLSPAQWLARFVSEARAMASLAKNRSPEPMPRISGEPARAPTTRCGSS